MNALCLVQPFVDAITFCIASESHPSADEIPTEGWGYFVDAYFHDGSFHLTFGPVALLFGAIAFFGWLAWWSRLSTWGTGDYETVEATLKIGEIGEVKIAPNYEARQIAYQAWVELSTRKIGLPFDPDHDVIIEVYDSWHKAFGEIRNLAKGIPAHRIEHSEDVRKLVELMFKVLNEGLRPHLTRWQAEFRRWYERAKANPENAEQSPQAIQRGFGQYVALTEELREIQSAMVQYRNFLLEVVDGRKSQRRPEGFAKNTESKI
jgi:hypothetical protein